MWLEPANILSMINIFIMGLFTFLVWRATKNGADVAKNTYELNKRLVKIEEQEREVTRQLCIQNISIELFEIKMKLSNQLKFLNPSIIKSIRKHHGLENEFLAKHFTHREIHLINYPWFNLEVYLEDYWMKSNGDIREDFDTDEVKELQEITKGMLEILDVGLNDLDKLKEK